jgi:tetratricopeptide (TPR) repeat protein
LAITHYSEALRIKPDYAHAHYDLGNALAEQGKLKLAITHYSEALRINPDFMEAQHNLKVTLHRMGKHKEVSKPINSP